MTRLLPALALAVFAVAAAPVSAQTMADFDAIDANKDGYLTWAEFEAARARDFALFDANKDGRISPREFIDRPGSDPGRRAQRERRFREIDKNGDGQITREEYAAFGRLIFDKLDGDRDGRVSRAEFEEALTGGPPLPPPGPGEEGPLRALFDRIDQNRDGFVAQSELDAARNEEFQRLDGNGDGRLTRDEYVAARGREAGRRFDELDRERKGFLTRLDYLEVGRRMLRAADRDRDGRLSWEEFRRAGIR
jgi:Ca2+-binding EF-hand superfamily protein